MNSESESPVSAANFDAFSSQITARAYPMRLLSDLIAVIYIGFIALVAGLLGAIYVLFPELGALSWEVLGRPQGRWAGAPLMLAVTPALTGIIGTLVTRSLPYGFVSVFVTVLGALAIIAALDSPIAPAISAGLLPLVLGVTSWWYPPGILFGSALLAAISVPWKRWVLSRHVPPALPADSAEGTSSPPALHWLSALLAFVVVAELAVQLTGMRFILFPPLVVILYEMLRHPADCPWIESTFRLPIACFAGAAGGYLLHAHIPSLVLAAMLSMAWGVIVLRTCRVHVPPTLAVALLPMVMGHTATIGYPVAVGLGTTLASAWYVGFARWFGQTPSALAT